MADEDLLFSSVHALARLIRGKKLSPVRLAEAYLSRIASLAPPLHAFVTVTADLAMRQARQAEKEINNGLYRGLLHGIPYAAKDLFAVRGYPTTWGAKPYAQQQFDEDAAVIRRLNDAGAVLLGKCAMSELAGGPPSASATGACRTPWDLSRWSGGSSSGSGASVAAALAPFALGTETWGSIMTPASFCGVTGLRPTFGRISRAGAMSLAWTMDKVGILGRDAKDCAAILPFLAGADPADPSAVKAPLKITLTKATARLAGLRVGFVKEDYEKFGDKDVADAFAECREVFSRAGSTPMEIAIPDHPYETVAATIIAAEEASAFEPLARSGSVSGIIDPDRRGEILGARRITAVDYLRCQRLRTLMLRDFSGVFERVDILLGSSTLQCAPPIEAGMDTIFSGGNIIEAAENLLGLPAISVPCGFNRNGLPIGLKIIGRQFAEADVLEAAHAFQSLTTWHLKRPDTTHFQ